MTKLKIKQLGLDFGSSVTTVVGFAEGVDFPILFNSGSSAYFYSAVAKERTNESYKFFTDAYDTDVKNYIFFGNIKENVKEEREIVRLFLRRVMESVRDASAHFGTTVYDFSDLKTVCYGYPEYYIEEGRESYRRIMNAILPEIISEVFGRQRGEVAIIGVGEPQLAAVAYNWTRLGDAGYPVAKDDVMLTLDFGGHTLDMALIKVGVGGVLEQIKSGSCEINPKGTGKMITQTICRRVYKRAIYDNAVDAAKIKLFSEGRQDFVPLKYDSLTKISLSYVTAADNEANDMIVVTERHGDGSMVTGYVNVGDIYDAAADYVKDFLKDAPLGGKKIKHVLFTGGTARINRLRSYIVGAIEAWLLPTRNELLVDDAGRATLAKASVMKCELALEAETAVALGAALIARDKKMLKSKRSAADPAPAAPSAPLPQVEHFGSIKARFAQAVMNLANTSTLDAQQRKRLLEELRKIYEMMTKFPR